MRSAAYKRLASKMLYNLSDIYFLCIRKQIFFLFFKRNVQRTFELLYVQVKIFKKKNFLLSASILDTADHNQYIYMGNWIIYRHLNHLHKNSILSIINKKLDISHKMTIKTFHYDKNYIIFLPKESFNLDFLYFMHQL